MKKHIVNKKRAVQKNWEKNFYLGKNFESKYFLNNHIFSTKKHFIREKRDDDKTFEVKNIINVIFLFYDFAGKIRDWNFFKDRKFG